MKQKFKTLSRTTQLTLIIALILSLSIVAYAAISAWVSRSWTSTLIKGDVMEMELNQATVSGEVTPGSTIAVSPRVKNVGTKQCLAFIKVGMPTYSTSTGELKAAYTFSADSGWIKVAEDGRTVGYGYNAVLGPDEEKVSALCESMTMMEMSGAEFLGLSDVNVRLVGYLADVDEYGDDVESAWMAIGE